MNYNNITTNITFPPPQQIKRSLEDEEVQFITCKRANTNTTTYLPSPCADGQDEQMTDNCAEDKQMTHDDYSEDGQMTDNYLPPVQQLLPPRPRTPPLGMTLSHYNPSTGTYTSSQLNSQHEVKSNICTGMTPVYRAPIERWGSCLI